MTTLEIVFTIAFWIILGVYISFKSNWFREADEPATLCFMAIALSPLAFLVWFICFFFLEDWNKY